MPVKQIVRTPPEPASPRRHESAARTLSVLIDATPLQSEHRSRGVGAYVREFVRVTEQQLHRRPRYVASTVDRARGGALLPPARTVRVFRPHTPAQVYWLYNEPALRLALARARPKLFFAPDFNGLVKNPYGLTVAVLHDLAALRLAAEGARGARNLSEGLSAWRWHAYYRKLKRADHLITRSESVKRDAVRLLGIPPKRLTVVAQGLDRARFTPHHGWGRFADEPPYFVHVGGRNANKNQARIVAAFARLGPEGENAKLYFAGPWGEGDLAWLEHERRRLGLGERVRHLGYVPDNDLPSLYGNATAVLFPSLEEGYGLPVLEGMASGGPVITSNCSSLPEVAGDAALLVDPRSTTELAEAMRLVLTDTELCDGLRQRGLERSSAFSWEALAGETWQVLDGLLRARGAVGR